jgi:3-oxoadipate enol-lactonase
MNSDRMAFITFTFHANHCRLNHMMLNYDEAGCGETIILVHGMVVSRYDWRAVTPALVEAGHRVLAVDLPGHGESITPDDPGAYTTEALLAALAEWIDQIAPEEDFYLAGHSLGGFLSLSYCLRYPQRVRRLAVIDPFYYPDQISPGLRPLARQTALLQWIHQKVPGGLFQWLMSWEPFVLAGVNAQDRREIAIQVQRTSPHILRLMRDLPDLRPQLGALQTPTLLIWGEHDTLLSPKSFPQLVAQLPQAEGFCLKGARHMPQFSHAEAVSQALVDFFQ